MRYGAFGWLDSTSFSWPFNNRISNNLKKSDNSKDSLGFYKTKVIRLDNSTLYKLITSNYIIGNGWWICYLIVVLKNAVLAINAAIVMKNKNGKKSMTASQSCGHIPAFTDCRKTLELVQSEYIAVDDTSWLEEIHMQS